MLLMCFLKVLCFYPILRKYYRSINDRQNKGINFALLQKAHDENNFPDFTNPDQ